MTLTASKLTDSAQSMTLKLTESAQSAEAKLTQATLKLEKASETMELLLAKLTDMQKKIDSKIETKPAHVESKRDSLELEFSKCPLDWFDFSLSTCLPLQSVINASVWEKYKIIAHNGDFPQADGKPSLKYDHSKWGDSNHPLKGPMLAAITLALLSKRLQPDDVIIGLHLIYYDYYDFFNYCNIITIALLLLI